MSVVGLDEAGIDLDGRVAVSHCCIVVLHGVKYVGPYNKDMKNAMIWTLTVRVVDCVLTIELDSFGVEIDGCMVVAFHELFVAQVLSYAS